MGLGDELGLDSSRLWQLLILDPACRRRLIGDRADQQGRVTPHVPDLRADGVQHSPPGEVIGRKPRWNETGEPMATAIRPIPTLLSQPDGPTSLQ